MIFNFSGKKKVTNTMKFFTWVLCTTLLTCPLVAQAASSEEDTDLSPSSLFLVRFPDGKEISLLGTMHTYNYKSLPDAVRSHIEELAECAAKKECILVQEQAEDRTVHLSSHLDASKENLEISSFQKWEKLVEEMVQTFLTPDEMFLLIKEFPHPLMVHELYTVYGSSMEYLFQQIKGLDMYVGELFPNEVSYGLDKDEDHPATDISPEKFTSYRLFAETVEEIEKKYWAPEKAQLLSSGKSTLEEEPWQKMFRKNLYQFFHYNPLFDSEDFATKFPKEGIPSIYRLQYRNQLWHTRLDEILPTAKNALIMVGMAHLGGETGLLNFFHQKGGHISQVWTNDPGSIMRKKPMDLTATPDLFERVTPETPLSLQPWKDCHRTSQIPGINSIGLWALIRLPLGEDYNPFSSGTIFDVDLDNFTVPSDLWSLPAGFSYPISQNNASYKLTFLSQYFPLLHEEEAQGYILTKYVSEGNYACEVHSISPEGLFVPREPKTTFTLSRQS